MITVESSVTIDRPLVDVFRYVTDPSNGPTWMFDCVGHVPLSERAVRQGTRFKWVLKAMGRREVEAEVQQHEPYVSHEIQILSGAPMGMRPHITYRFEDSGSSTRFTRRVVAQPGSAFRMIEPFARGAIKKYNVRFLADLKRVVEA